jgi:uncharacterized protein (DUF302 family)
MSPLPIRPSASQRAEPLLGVSMTEMAYVRRSNASFADTVEAVQLAAENQGWTVLTVHDLKRRFLNKGFDWSSGLSIVETCNSKYATEMVAANPRLALYLPCRIVVREDRDGVEVSVINVSYVAEQFPETDFGASMTAPEADVKAIVDGAVE